MFIVNGGSLDSCKEDCRLHFLVFEDDCQFCRTVGLRVKSRHRVGCDNSTCVPVFSCLFAGATSEEEA